VSYEQLTVEIIFGSSLFPGNFIFHRLCAGAQVEENGCVISVAAILSCLQRQRGVARLPGLKSRVRSIDEMACPTSPLPSFLA
jgi:hypothetical protein